MKHFYTLCLILVTTVTVYAQDIIIKTDKSEIKAKVLEVEEFNIKYKQWDFQDGPTYSIRKNDVFMIIYKNGKRETFETTGPVSAPIQNNNRNTAPVYNNQNQTQTQPTNQAVNPISNVLGAAAASSDGNVIYTPTRIVGSYTSIDGGGSIALNMDQDYSLLPNFVNWGANVFGSYMSIENSYVSSESIGVGAGLYGLGYLPVNRMMGNLENQNRGFFPFIRAGYSYGYYTTTTEMEDYGYGSSSNESSGGAGAFSWALGADYRFSDTFGLTVYTYEFAAFSFGINLQL